MKTDERNPHDWLLLASERLEKANALYKLFGPSYACLSTGVPRPITVSGAPGDDAKHYQGRAVKRANEFGDPIPAPKGRRADGAVLERPLFTCD